MLEPIVIDAGICNGCPRLNGTALTVYEVVAGCDEIGRDAFLREYPDVTPEALEAALAWCRERRCDAAGAHCDGCSLRAADDGLHSVADFVRQYREIRFLDSDEVIASQGEGIITLPGTTADMEDHWRGENGWEIARRLSGMP